MRYIALFILSLIFWLLLTFKLTVPNIIVGSVASIICSFFFGRFFITNVYKLLQPQRYFWFVVYLIVFIWECLKANLDVAYRVLHPAMPIRPGIVKVKTTLKSDLAKCFSQIQ
jgi:multicomponent Na+:H+ antiporter subunit E